MTHANRASRFAAFLGILILLLPDSASAYIDPGAGNILLQGLLGAIAGGVAVGATYWRKIREFFSRAGQDDVTPEQ
jgi:hypothetical protein